jgi:hypothetical protein
LPIFDCRLPIVLATAITKSAVAKRNRQLAIGNRKSEIGVEIGNRKFAIGKSAVEIGNWQSEIGNKRMGE